MTSVDLGGKTLLPGVYCFNTSADVTGILTLDLNNDADGVFIFQIGSTLTTSANSAVQVINGSAACGNIIWKVGSSATLGLASQFKGNILALASVTLTTGAKNNGGLYGLNGGVTLDTSAVQACGLPPPVCLTDDECLDDGNICTDEACDPISPDADSFGCTHPNNTAPCDDNQFCNGEDVCANGLCGHAGDPCLGGGECGDTCNELADNCLVLAGTPCRPANGVCDAEESCTGSSSDCPVDQFLSSSTQCRAADGVCDAAENCTGVSALCPEDGFLSTAVQCRASTGVCDVAETCTGSSGVCPTDAFRGAGFACTNDADVCTDDVCNGSGACVHNDNTAACDDGAFCTVHSAATTFTATASRPATSRPAA